MTDAIHRAREQRLTWLLEEHLSGRSCPDLTATILARAAALRPQRRAAPRRWAAAAVLLGAGVVAAVLVARMGSVDRGAGKAPADAPHPAVVAPLTPQDPVRREDVPLVSFRSAADVLALPLETRSLRGFNIVDADLEPLARLEALQFLDLGGLEEDEEGTIPDNRVSDAGLAHVARCRSLRWLSLYRAERFTAAGLRALAALPNLQHLVLRNGVDAAGLVELARFPALHKVDVSWCFEVAPEGFAALSKCTRLTELRLAGCHQLGGRHLGFLAELRNLRVLDLSGLDGRTRGSGHLQRTHAAEGVGLTDEIVDQIADLPALEVLWLNGCRALTDASLRSLSRSRALRELELGDRTGITLAGLDSLRTLDLRILDLSDAKSFTDAEVRSWCAAVPRWRVVLPSGEEIGGQGR